MNIIWIWIVILKIAVVNVLRTQCRLQGWVDSLRTYIFESGFMIVLMLLLWVHWTFPPNCVCHHIIKVLRLRILTESRTVGHGGWCDTSKSPGNERVNAFLTDHAMFHFSSYPAIFFGNCGMPKLFFFKLKKYRPSKIGWTPFINDLNNGAICWITYFDAAPDVSRTKFIMYSTCYVGHVYLYVVEWREEWLGTEFGNEIRYGRCALTPS